MSGRSRRRRSSGGGGGRQGKTNRGNDGVGNGMQQEQLGGGNGQQGMNVLQLAMQVPQNQVPTKSTRKAPKKRDRKKRGKQSGDKHLRNKHRTGPMEKLDSKTINDVYKVQYDRKIGSSDTNKGFWKAGGESERSASMASSRLDQALGTNMLSNDIEAKHNGEWGITSSQVKGESLQSNRYEDVTERTMHQHRAIGEDESWDNVKRIWGMGNERHFDDENQTIHDIVGTDHRDVDLSNPETQKGMANLQVLDYLTAQRDRHEGNIFIDDETGKVSGIDNDMAFNELDTPEVLEEEDGVGLEKFEGLPQQIDEDLGYRILSMTETEFVRILEGARNDKAKLTREQIATALERFTRLQSHIDDLRVDDKLVSTWNDDTYQESLESGKGYLARAHKARNPGDDD